MTVEEIQKVAEAAFVVFSAGGTFALVKRSAAEARRRADAANRRLDDHLEDQRKSDLLLAKDISEIKTTLVHFGHEQDRTRDAVHQSRTEISTRLGRIEERLLDGHVRP